MFIKIMLMPLRVHSIPNLILLMIKGHFRQDIQQARKLLQQEGYTKEHPLTLTVSTYNGRPELPKIAQVVQSDAKKQILILSYAMLMILMVTLKIKVNGMLHYIALEHFREATLVISLIKLIKHKVLLMPGIIAIIV